MKRPLRIACAGASGTGKTTLAEFIARTYDLPVNPVGSRSVAAGMGYESPYDVDKVPGEREKFQRRLLVAKTAWEDANDSFVTDRTTLDNLAYSTLHHVHSIDEALIEDAFKGFARYTHVIYCPVAVFCHTGSDAARVHDMAYQRLFDLLIEGMLAAAMCNAPSMGFHIMRENDRERRQITVRRDIDQYLLSDD